MESEAQTNILIIDACRDNPLARNLARAMGTRSLEIGRGLAAVESGVGTLISFSTQPGNVALDGTGRNSPFAGALTKHMSLSNDDLSTLLIKVRNDVIAQTKRRQVPWEHSALTGQFYFRAQAEPKPDSRSPSLSEAERTWMLIKDTESVAVLAAFIARYKDTFYAEVARERIEELKTRATAALEARRNAEEAEQRRLAALKAEEERRKRATEAEARRSAEEAEQRRLAALKAEEERKARVAEAEARRSAEEAEQRRLAALRAEEERRARAAAAEALTQAKRKAEEAEQQRLAALRAEQERVRARFSDAMSQGDAAYKSQNWKRGNST
jgi:uncharacterized caspase-like protein